MDKGTHTNPSSVSAAAPDFLSRRAAWNRQQRSHPRVPLLEAHCEPRGSQDLGDDPGNLSAPSRIRPPLRHPATHAAEPLPSAGLPRTGPRSAGPSLGPRGRREARVRSFNFKSSPGGGRPPGTNWGPGRGPGGTRNPKHRAAASNRVLSTRTSQPTRKTNWPDPGSGAAEGPVRPLFPHIHQITRWEEAACLLAPEPPAPAAAGLAQPCPAH